MLLTMQTIMVSNGRRITANDVDGIRCLIDAHPAWTRARLSVELCKAWNGYAPNGPSADGFAEPSCGNYTNANSSLCRRRLIPAIVSSATGTSPRFLIPPR